MNDKPFPPDEQYSSSADDDDDNVKKKKLENYAKIMKCILTNEGGTEPNLHFKKKKINDGLVLQKNNVDYDNLSHQLVNILFDVPLSSATNDDLVWELMCCAENKKQAKCENGTHQCCCFFF